MKAEILNAVRGCSPNLQNSIIKSISVDKRSRVVTIRIITDVIFTPQDKARAEGVLRPYVPAYFECVAELIKLTPDEEMIKRKITDIIKTDHIALSALLREGDITVKREENGFSFCIKGVNDVLPDDLCTTVREELKKNFCGEFTGKIEKTEFNPDDYEIPEDEDEPDYDMPVRTFPIEKFSFLEGTEKRTQAIYIADLNLVPSEAVVCGQITDIREQTYINKSNVEKQRFSITLSDGSASAYITYFPRMKTIAKIRALKEGDYIVCWGENSEYRGNLRYTARIIDYGRPPKDFAPQKRASKPVPRYYHVIKPQPFADREQTDIFSDSSLPECLTQNQFVVFDLETTGLNSSPVTGNMDKIIEIAAYKISGGEISESFTSFIDPGVRISDEITNLTGITAEMIKDAPSCDEAMPDFFKFCDGCILVGHNIANFDFKFVDYYCSRVGYILERKIIDTLLLSQELLFLSNYKLNTVAERFGITFNHHRACDDALATAKLFIELLKMKKSLPDFM